MNPSNLWHGIYGLLIQAAVSIAVLPLAVFFGFSPLAGVWMGAAAATAAFVMREYTQREGQICLQRSAALGRVYTPEELQPWEGFTGWTNHDDPANKYDRWFDAGSPVVGCLLAALAVTVFLNGGR